MFFMNRVGIKRRAAGAIRIKEVLLPLIYTWLRRDLGAICNYPTFELTEFEVTTLRCRKLSKPNEIPSHVVQVEQLARQNSFTGSGRNRAIRGVGLTKEH